MWNERGQRAEEGRGKRAAWVGARGPRGMHTSEPNITRDSLQEAGQRSTSFQVRVQLYLVKLMAIRTILARHYCRGI